MKKWILSCIIIFTCAFLALSRFRMATATDFEDIRDAVNIFVQQEARNNKEKPYDFKDICLFEEKLKQKILEYQQSIGGISTRWHIFDDYRKVKRYYTHIEDEVNKVSQAVVTEITPSCGNAWAQLKRILSKVENLVEDDVKMTDVERADIFAHLQLYPFFAYATWGKTVNDQNLSELMPKICNESATISKLMNKTMNEVRLAGDKVFGKKLTDVYEEVQRSEAIRNMVDVIIQYCWQAFFVHGTFNCMSVDELKKIRKQYTVILTHENRIVLCKGENETGIVLGNGDSASQFFETAASNLFEMHLSHGNASYYARNYVLNTVFNNVRDKPYCEDILNIEEASFAAFSKEKFSPDVRRRQRTLKYRYKFSKALQNIEETKTVILRCPTWMECIRYEMNLHMQLEVELENADSSEIEYLALAAVQYVQATEDYTPVHKMKVRDGRVDVLDAEKLDKFLLMRVETCVMIALMTHLNRQNISWYEVYTMRKNNKNLRKLMDVTATLAVALYDRQNRGSKILRTFLSQMCVAINDSGKFYVENSTKTDATFLLKSDLSSSRYFRDCKLAAATPYATALGERLQQLVLDDYVPKGQFNVEADIVWSMKAEDFPVMKETETAMTEAFEIVKSIQEPREYLRGRKAVMKEVDNAVDNMNIPEKYPLDQAQVIFYMKVAKAAYRHKFKQAFDVEEYMMMRSKDYNAEDRVASIAAKIHTDIGAGGVRVSMRACVDLIAESLDPYLLQIRAKFGERFAGRFAGNGEDNDGIRIVEMAYNFAIKQFYEIYLSSAGFAIERLSADFKVYAELRNAISYLLKKVSTKLTTTSGLFHELLDLSNVVDTTAFFLAPDNQVIASNTFNQGFEEIYNTLFVYEPLQGTSMSHIDLLVLQDAIQEHMVEGRPLTHSFKNDYYGFEEGGIVLMSETADYLLNGACLSGFKQLVHCFIVSLTHYPHSDCVGLLKENLLQRTTNAIQDVSAVEGHPKEKTYYMYSNTLLINAMLQRCTAKHYRYLLRVSNLSPTDYAGFVVNRSAASIMGGHASMKPNLLAAILVGVTKREFVDAFFRESASLRFGTTVDDTLRADMESELAQALNRALKHLLTNILEPLGYCTASLAELFSSNESAKELIEGYIAGLVSALKQTMMSNCKEQAMFTWQYKIHLLENGSIGVGEIQERAQLLHLENFIDYSTLMAQSIDNVPTLDCSNLTLQLQQGACISFIDVLSARNRIQTPNSLLRDYNDDVKLIMDKKCILSTRKLDAFKRSITHLLKELSKQSYRTACTKLYRDVDTHARELTKKRRGITNNTYIGYVQQLSLADFIKGEVSIKKMATLQKYDDPEIAATTIIEKWKCLLVEKKIGVNPIDVETILNMTGSSVVKTIFKEKGWSNETDFKLIHRELADTVAETANRLLKVVFDCHLEKLGFQRSRAKKYSVQYSIVHDTISAVIKASKAAASNYLQSEAFCPDAGNFFDEIWLGLDSKGIIGKSCEDTIGDYKINPHTRERYFISNLPDVHIGLNLTKL